MEDTSHPRGAFLIPEASFLSVAPRMPPSIPGHDESVTIQHESLPWVVLIMLEAEETREFLLNHTIVPMGPIPTVSDIFESDPLSPTSGWRGQAAYRPGTGGGHEVLPLISSIARPPDTA